MRPNSTIHDNESQHSAKHCPPVECTAQNLPECSMETCSQLKCIDEDDEASSVRLNIPQVGMRPIQQPKAEEGLQDELTAKTDSKHH